MLPRLFWGPTPTLPHREGAPSGKESPSPTLPHREGAPSGKRK